MAVVFTLTAALVFNWKENTMNIRFEDGQQVLRLFPSQDVAEKSAGRRLGELAAQQHKSGIGWLLVNEETGQRYDDAGLIPEVTTK